MTTKLQPRVAPPHLEGTHVWAVVLSPRDGKRGGWCPMVTRIGYFVSKGSDQKVLATTNLAMGSPCWTLERLYGQYRYYLDQYPDATCDDAGFKAWLETQPTIRSREVANEKKGLRSRA